MIEIILFAVVILLIPAAYAGLSYAPWLPTRSDDLSRVIDLAGLKAGDVFYDLGSGTGKVVFEAAKKDGVIAKGIELYVPLHLFAMVKKWLIQSPAQFFCKNLFRQDISDASVIYLFGTPKTLQGRLKEKIWHECKPGTKILSYAFSFEDLVPEFVSKPNQTDLTIRKYIVD